MNIQYPPMKATGPKDAKIMCIGEAPGAEEMMTGQPFVGWSGKELRKMLWQSGIDPAQVYMTNVFFIRPQDNKIENFCTRTRDKGIAGMPALSPGNYVYNPFTPELERLYDEIEAVRPNVIAALGNTPCWAVFRQTPKISLLRGRVREASIRGRKYKVLPSFHPAYILRQWKERVVVLQDLHKLKRESGYPDIRLPVRKVLIDPTFQEALDFLDRCNHANEITVDVETKGGQITVCGFGLSPAEAAVIPFVDHRRPDYCYWSEEKELVLVKRIRQVLANPHVAKILQNGLYDITYFWENWRAVVRGPFEDTMLIQHALWPELKKDLGTLASIHTDEASWKTMRLRNRDDFKREE
jgi:DNA polymerase